MTSPSRVAFAAQLILASAFVVVVVGVFAPKAYAFATCDNYAPTFVSGRCPFSGTLRAATGYGEHFNHTAAGNEIAVSASRSIELWYFFPGTQTIYQHASTFGTYLALGSSNGTKIDPACANDGSSVTGNCDVQYIA